jgi:proteasome accessory factor A
MLPIMGLECEYGILRFLSAGKTATQAVATALMLAIQSRLTHLPNPRSGIFLASGARFYIDAADHPEWCTAECTNPTDLVCQVRAGERHLAQGVEQMPGTVLLRGNVTYARPCATWGCHESHLHTCGRPLLRRVLRAHLLTRIIYTGSGGLDPFHPGVVFALSPRALHFDRGSSSLHAGSGLDGREESLACRPYQRAHIVLGESACLDLPLWLRVATTSLLVRLSDEGLLTPKDVPVLDEPADALRAIALDTGLAAPLGSAGSRRTALEIQRAYLELVERKLASRCLPDWAPLACARWRMVLEALADGAGDAVDCLEWALKRRIMTDHLRRHGFDWEALDRFNTAVDEAMSGLGDERPHEAGLAAWLTRKLGRHGYRRPEVDRILKLRGELSEIDMRFAMLPGGIHEAIAASVPSRLPEITEDRIRHAMLWPPEDTRAAVRGRYIRRLSCDGDRYAAGWAAITDRRKRLRLDLSDPFCWDARWKKFRNSSREQMLPCGGGFPPLEMEME